MPAATVDNVEIHAKAEGYCAGGSHPEPAIDKFPLLAWTAAHPIFGRMVVHTEDQRASVHDVALALAETGSIEGAAAKVGTTLEHAAQAADYADAWRKLHAN